MKLVFCGTPAFAVPTLRAVLEAGHEVALVLTQPDRPAGRKMEVHAPPVKQLALEHGLAVLQPERLKRNEALRATLEAIRPEAILVVAYGRIIPDWMLALPRFGNLNLHGSLLPKYRGAAPVQWAVANGETETGITTMRLDAGLDTGDMLLRKRVPVGPDATATELLLTLAELGAALVLETLEGLQRGTLPPTPQAHGEATLAPILTRDDGHMDFNRNVAQQIYDRWRGFYPWPGAWSTFRGKRFLVHALGPQPAGEVAVLSPGSLAIEDGQLLVGAAQGTSLRLLEVQIEGKPRMTGAALALAFQVQAGEQLG